MGNASGIECFAIEIPVLIVVSGLIYLILYLIAKTHPNGKIAQLKCVREMWMLFNGLLLGFLVLGLCVFVFRMPLWPQNVIVFICYGLFSGSVVSQFIVIVMRHFSAHKNQEIYKYLFKVLRYELYISLILMFVLLTGEYLL